VIERKVIGNHEVRVRGQICDSGICESELDEIWVIANLFGGPIRLVEVGNEDPQELRAFATGLFGKLP
jgi:hypothetical protein